LSCCWERERAASSSGSDACHPELPEAQAGDGRQGGHASDDYPTARDGNERDQCKIDHERGGGLTRRRLGYNLRMAFRLTPHERGFYPLFTRAAENIVLAAEELAAMVAAPPEERAPIAKRVKDAENAGDALTHEIMVKLNSTFVTPFDREDIYRLTSSLDDVVDAMEEAADRIVLYRLGELPSGVTAQVDVLRRAAAATAEAMPRLTTMSELREYWVHVNSLEDEADVVYRALLVDLLAPPDDSPVADVLTILKIKEIVEVLEEAADAFETVANTVESIVVKES
jgi:predicted phosphate transport protein (TIGR00153 family)